MAFIPALIGGISALAGGLFGQPQTQKTTSNVDNTTTNNQTQNQSGSASSLPNYDPLQLQMRNYLLNQFYQQTNPSAINSLVSNYVGTGTNTINQNANGQQQNLKAFLGAQGLSYSPAAASAYENADAGRVAQINQLQNSATPLAAQLAQSRLTSFGSFLSGLPVGQSGQTSSMGTSDTTQHQFGTVANTSTTPNTSIASGLASGASSLGLLYGLGAFKNNGSGGGGGGGGNN